MSPGAGAGRHRDALAELSAQSTGQARHIKAWENILAAVNEKMNAARLLSRAMWLVNSGALHCWCRVMHTMTWKLDDATLRVTSCNGPQEAMQDSLDE